MYLLFDIGATKTRIATTEDKTTIQNLQVIQTPQDFTQAMHMLQVYASKGKYSAAAGCVPGPLDEKKTYILNPPNLPNWKGKPIKKELESIFHAPVVLENDAATAAVGEAHFGAGKQHNIVAFLTISTGVGGARVVNKCIDANSFGFEPGHHIIYPDSSRICGCGGKGHLEAYVSGSAITKEYNKSPAEIDDRAVWEEVTGALALGVHNTIVYWSPDVVILGGSLMNKISIGMVEDKVKKLLTIFPLVTEIKKALLGDEVGIYGSLALLHG